MLALRPRLRVGNDRDDLVVGQNKIAVNPVDFLALWDVSIKGLGGKGYKVRGPRRRGHGGQDDQDTHSLVDDGAHHRFLIVKNDYGGPSSRNASRAVCGRATAR